MKHAIRTLIRFDEPYRQFELKETESKGTPSFFAHKNAQHAERQRIEGTIDRRLEVNRKRLLAFFHGEQNTDLKLKAFAIGNRIDALAVCMEGMADDTKIGDLILRPCHYADPDSVSEKRLILYLTENVLNLSETERAEQWDEIVQAVAEGRTAILVDGQKSAILADTRGFVSRPVEKPQNEMTILGPKEAFTENIRTNVTLLRRILKRPDFVCRFRDAGGTNRT